MVQDSSTQESSTQTPPKGYFFEDIQIGMEASCTRTVEEADIAAFARISGDVNPVHLDEAYAAASPFKGRIAHGILTASYISAVFGAKLPGPGCVYVSQTLKFRAPVRIGDEVTAKVVVTGLVPEKKRVIFSCSCSVKDTVVLEGEAALMVPSRAA
jgi:3-hydroxybutyryl-CoA dehydratase